MMRRFKAVSRAAIAPVGLMMLSSAAHAAEKGMPQLNFANPLTLAQVVWLAIIFFALYLLLDRWALPKVSEVLDMRASKIAADLDAAKQARIKLRKVSIRYRKVSFIYRSMT